MQGKSLMLQGTGSGVGKSLLCAAILRILHQDGLICAPFKAQNMALNSFVTRDGLEMGRAQVTQAYAAGIEPDVRMNPVLLKPTGDRQSQVIVCGEPIGNLSAVEYERYKPQLREQIRKIYDALEAEVDCVVIEGAGSPAEINLMASDIVNMSMARAADAPVILIGDIDPGGVFAALYGTVMLLPEADRARIKGILINKFRGDVRILKPGLDMLENLLRIPVIGVIPYANIDIEEEDSMGLSESGTVQAGLVNIGIVRLPHLSNYTDFSLLSLEKGVHVFYTQSPETLSDCDLIILPGTKNTIEDLLWMNMNGMAEAVKKAAANGQLVMGICGGYQMLGHMLSDPEFTESSRGETEGLGLLPFDVLFQGKKKTLQSRLRFAETDSFLNPLAGTLVQGYEIHQGRNLFYPGVHPLLVHENGEADGIINDAGNVFGTYLHGIFDSGILLRQILSSIQGGEERCSRSTSLLTMQAYRERELNRLADLVRANLDLHDLYGILRGEPVPCGRWRT